MTVVEMNIGMDPLIYTIEGGRVGGRPAPAKVPWDLEAIKRAGFATIVSFECDRLDGEAIRKAGLEHVRICVEDFQPPTLEQLIEFNELLDRRLSEGKKVLTHCWAGRGRTGTFLSSRLIWTGRGAEEAIAEVRGKVFATQGTLAGAIEPSQEEALFAFERLVRDRVTRPGGARPPSR